MKMQRTATVTRETGETQITLTLNLDGSGKCDVQNPIGFFDHMLRSFCKHGLFDLSGTIKGDLNVDQHHTIDCQGLGRLRGHLPQRLVFVPDGRKPFARGG